MPRDSCPPPPAATECGGQQELLAAQAAATEEMGRGQWLTVGGKKLFANSTVIQIKRLILPLFGSRPLFMRIREKVSESHHTDDLLIKWNSCFSRVLW